MFKETLTKGKNVGICISFIHFKNLKQTSPTLVRTVCVQQDVFIIDEIFLCLLLLFKFSVAASTNLLNYQSFLWVLLK